MHQYEQVLRDRTTTGREAGRAGPWSLQCKLDTGKAQKQVGGHARGNRTSEDLNASHVVPTARAEAIEATAVWPVRKKQKRREHDVVLRLDRPFKQWVMSSVVITF
jgi:hypothetical protein